MASFEIRKSRAGLGMFHFDLPRKALGLGRKASYSGYVPTTPRLRLCSCPGGRWKRGQETPLYCLILCILHLFRVRHLGGWGTGQVAVQGRRHVVFFVAAPAVCSSPHHAVDVL